MSLSNYRTAIWSDIKAAIAVRIVENEQRLMSCRDPDVRVILLRIDADDRQRLMAAERWIGYHQG